MKPRSSSRERVAEIKLTNPHSILVFDVTDSSGKVVRWQAEMGGGNQLTKQFGWTKDMPKIGEKVTLNGRKVKSGAPYMNMTEKAQIILTDSGKEIFRTMNFDGPPAASTSAKAAVIASADIAGIQTRAFRPQVELKPGT